MLHSSYKGMITSILLIGLMAAGLIGSSVIAEEKGELPISAQPDAQAVFNINWVQKDLEDILKFLRDRTGLNITLEKPEYNTKVTLNLRDVQYEDILDEIVAIEDVRKKGGKGCGFAQESFWL